jgi:hypothetical protein
MSARYLPRAPALRILSAPGRRVAGVREGETVRRGSREKNSGQDTRLNGGGMKGGGEGFYFMNNPPPPAELVDLPEESAPATGTSGTLRVPTLHFGGAALFIALKP